MAKFELEPYHRNISDNDLINDVKRVAALLKKNTITIEDYNDNGNFHATTLTRRFKSWFKVLEKSELQPSRSPLNISDENLFENIQDIWLKLGRQPRYSELFPPLSKYSGGTYENRFGTWRKALEKFVEIANGEEAFDQSEKTLKPKTKKNRRNQRQPNWRQRFIVMTRDKSKCRLCGSSPATDSSIIFHIDHIIPWAKGGETTIENLQTLCSKCNIGKSDLA